VRCTEATDEPTHPTDGSTDYEPDAAALEALAAYEKAQKQPGKTPASAKGVKESKLANEAKFAQFKKEQTQQMKAQGELAAAQLVGGLTAAEVPPMIAGEAETAAVEDHRVKLDDSERARSSAPTVVTGVTLGGNDGGDPSLPSTGPVVVLPVLEPPTPVTNPALPLPPQSADSGHSQPPSQMLQLPSSLPPFGSPLFPLGMPPPSFMPPFFGSMPMPMATQPPLPAWYVAAGGPFGPLGSLPAQLQQRLGLPPVPYCHNGAGAGYPFNAAGTGSNGTGPFGGGVMSTGALGITSNVENGHGTGTVNRYHPLLTANGHASAAADIISCDDLGAVEIAEDSCLSSADPTAVEGDADRTGELSTHTRSNAVSGRLGEQGAVAYLQAYRIRGEAAFSDVVWVNREAEAGLPFDIVVTLPNGTTKVCEVKTRSVPGHAGEMQDFASKQWVISPAEITFATETKDAYFGMFLNVRIDYGSGAAPRLVQSAARIVGLERGLIHSIAVDRTASLFVQMNSA
jgi:hypothetical protein